MVNIKLSTAFKTFLFLLLLFFSASKVEAQNQNLLEHNWYFGNSPSGILFGQGNNEATMVSDQATPFGIGGSAVATDPRTGQVLFYTDGLRVYDLSHQQMPNGGALNGNTTGNQPVAILPVPGETRQYYIITNTANGGGAGNLSYSIVDLNLQGNADPDFAPQGEVVSPNTAIAAITNVSEAMITFHTGTGTVPDPYRYWILVQPHNSDEFELYEATAGNTFTLVSSVNIPFSMIAGNFSLHRPTGKIAVSPLSTGANVTLLDIDFSTQTLAYDTVILNSGNNDAGAYAIYDTEWSNDGNFLFVSRTGDGVNNGTVRRFDLSNPQASGVVVTPSPLSRSFGLKRGPDGNIYHLYQETNGGPFLLGQIENIDSAAAVLQYNSLAFDNSDFNGRQFPEFSPNVPVEFLDAAFDVLGTCMGNPTKFFPSVDPVADSYTWDFGDGTVANYNTFVAPIHQYESEGQYTVSLTARINGRDTVVSQLIDIVQSDSVDLGQDTVICPGETLVLDAGPGGQSYLWSVPGETGQTLTISEAGTYWVVVDYGNCTSYDEIMIEVYGEQEQFANFWYFGDGAGIDFNDENGPQPVTGASQAPHGVATISDANGDLIFYTDGNTVFDRDHAPRASNIGGDNQSVQSSLIIPFPDDPTMFYIFTTENIPDEFGEHRYRLSYAIYDMKELAAGPVVLDNKTLYEGSTERLAGLTGGGGSWMLSHEYGTNVFRAYPISAEGIGNPVRSSAGSVHNSSVQQSGEGYMQFSPDGQKVAVAFVNASGENIVEVFDFDQATGEVSNPIQLTFDESDPPFQVYGLAFSPGGGNLYVSLTGTTSRLYEFKMHVDEEDSIMDSRSQLLEASAAFGAIQAGPDGQMYMAVDGQDFLIAFAPNEDSTQTASVDFNSSRFQLAGGTTSGMGLPNFAQNVSTASGGPSMLVSDGCLGTPSDFQAIPTSIIDIFFWDYEEGTSDLDQFQHTFSAARDYTIVLELSNRCGLDTTLTQVITIHEPPVPTLPDFGLLCEDGLELDADTNNVPGWSFLWNTADTTKIITVVAPGTYTVNVTDQNSCQAGDTVEVYDGRPPLNLPDDMTMCQDEPAFNLDAGNPSSGTQYTWTINGAPASTSRFQNVDTSVPGVYNYKIDIVDGLTGCFASDSVLITINPLPDAPVVNIIQPPTCGNADGEVEIIGDFTGLTVGWFDSNNTLLSSTPQLTNVASGVYNFVLTDNLSGCTYEEAVTLNDDPAPFVVTTNIAPDCDGSTVGVELDNGPYTSVTYSLIRIENNDITTGTPNNDIFDIDDVPSGNYTLSVTADGCTNSTDFIINQLPTAQVDVDPIFDVCTGAADLSLNSVSDEQLVEWWAVATTPPSGILMGTGNSVTLTDSAPSGDYFVVVTGDPGFCDTTAAITVNIRNSPTVQIDEVSDGCDGSAVLEANVTANGSGNYVYSWDTGEQTRRITITNSGSYSVDVRDQSTGCVGSGGPFDATVLEPLEVTIELSDVPCQNGETLTLTAVTNQTPDTYRWFQNNVLLQPQTEADMETFSEGIFRVEVELQSCVSTAERSVIRLPVTPSDIEPLYEICPEEPVNEVAEIAPGNFTVFNAFNIDTGEEYFEASPGVFELVEEAPVRFVLINVFNCVTLDTTVIDVRCEPSVVAPTAFSPLAGLEVNRTFRIWPLFVSDFEIFIYNRWGELIFHSDDLDFMQNEGWDGTKNGKVQPNGTYAYIMKFRSLTNPERGQFEKRGGVNLLR